MDAPSIINPDIRCKPVKWNKNAFNFRVISFRQKLGSNSVPTGSVPHGEAGGPQSGLYPARRRTEARGGVSGRVRRQEPPEGLQGP